MNEKQLLDPAGFHEICRNILDEHPEVQVVAVSITYDDGSKVTFEFDENLRQEMEAKRSLAV